MEKSGFVVWCVLVVPHNATKNVIANKELDQQVHKESIKNAKESHKAVCSVCDGTFHEEIKELSDALSLEHNLDCTCDWQLAHHTAK